MSPIPVIVRLLATLPYVLVLVYFFLPDRMFFMNEIGIWHAIIFNVAYLLFVYYLSKRVLRITGNKSKARDALLTLIFFNPYLIYYVWKKDDQLIKESIATI